MRVRLIPQPIPSWTAFQIFVCDHSPALRTTVGYLDSIDASATEMSTIFQVKKPKFGPTIFLIFKVGLFIISFLFIRFTGAKNCKISEAFFNRLCIRSSNLFKGY